MNTKRLFSRVTSTTVSSIVLSGALAMTVSFAPITAQAEILGIGANAKIVKKASMPNHGDSMFTVSKKFGQASQVKTSKGKITKHNPKITQWIYSTFSVYFENKHVIHSVVRR